MADAPDNAAYLLAQANGALAQGRILTADPADDNLQFSDGGPGGSYTLKPTLTLKSLTQLASPGLLAFDGVSTVNPRTLQSDTILITNSGGGSANPQLEVINNSTIQKVTVSSGGGAAVGARSNLNFLNGGNVSITPVENPGTNSIDITVSANTGLPVDASVALLSSDPGHSFNLGSLGNGILKIGVSAGVATPSIASAGTDYIIPSAGLNSLNGITPSVNGLIYGTSTTTWGQLAAGPNGYFLRSNSGVPTWTAPGAGSGTVTSITLATTSGLLLTGTNPITTSGTVNVDLPVGSVVGQALTITNLSPYTLGFAAGPSSAATYLTQTGANLPTNGINLGATLAQLGIGKTTPTTTLDVLSIVNNAFIEYPGVRFSIDSSATNARPSFAFYGYSGTGAFQCELNMFAARGTVSSPTTIVSQDRIGQISFNGFDGTNTFINHDNASIIAQASENFTPTARGSTLTFSVTKSTTVTPIYPLRISDQGFLGVNNLAPATPLDVFNDFSTSGTAIGLRLVQNIATGSAQLQMNTYFSSSTTGGSTIVMTSARGTNTASTALQNGDILGRIGSTGGNGANSVSGISAALITQARGTFTGSASPTAILFRTTAVNTLTDSMIIDSTGNVGIGPNFVTTAPAYRLDVYNNTAAVSNSLSARFALDTTAADRGGVRIHTASSSGVSTAAALYLYASRGTVAAPTAIQANDYIGSLDFLGQSTTQIVQPAQILAQATENFVAASACGGNMIFKTVQTGTAVLAQRMMLSNAGYLGIGLNLAPTVALDILAMSPNSGNNIYAINSVTTGAAGSSGGMQMTNYGGSSPTVKFTMRGSCGSQGGTANVTNGQGVTTLDFQGNGGTGATPTFVQGARIDSVATANWSTTSAPTQINFYITAVGATGGNIQAMAMGTADNSTSNVGINAAPLSGNALNVVGLAKKGGAGSTTLWDTTSDVRLKTDIEDISGALDTINSLKPRTFKYSKKYIEEMNANIVNNAEVCSEDAVVYGFIADELETVMPSCVTVTKQKIAGFEKIKSVNMHDISILVYKAIQELSAKVDSLSAQNVALRADNEHLMDRIINLETAGA